VRSAGCEPCRYAADSPTSLDRAPPAMGHAGMPATTRSVLGATPGDRLTTPPGHGNGSNGLTGTFHQPPAPPRSRHRTLMKSRG
jgi:hypothetical protein